MLFKKPEFKSVSGQFSLVQFSLLSSNTGTSLKIKNEIQINLYE